MKTMKVISSLIISVLLLSFGTAAFAQEAELPDPGLTPDSPFYFLETITEGIGTFFTFGDLKKAERYAALAAERLAEAQAIAGKGDPELTEKTLKRYGMQLQNSIARAEKAQAKGKNIEKVIEVVTRVGQATSKHLEVLAEVYEKVPEQAKPAIENAMKASIKGHEKAVEALKARYALGEVPEAASLPEKVPEEVRERVQRRVQQELEIEEVLEDIESAESIRDFCIEQGGPPEMCEKLPIEEPQSFKALENWCLEQGGPPEICSTLKDKCRELGVTAPDTCFRILSLSTTSVSGASRMVSPEIFPAPSLSAEGTEVEGTEKEKPTEEDMAVVQGSGSSRAFCLGLGGQPETCEKIPTQGFKSFRSLQAFCVETGGPPEYCASLEAKCKETGVTNAEECFRVISTATLKTFQSIELKTHPAPTLPSEGIEAEGTEGEEATEEDVPAPEQQREPDISKVMIYSTPTCPYCLRAKQWLQENNIAYEEFDISQNEQKQNELAEKVGRVIVPVIEAGNEIIVGFDEDRLSDSLGL